MTLPQLADRPQNWIEFERAVLHGVLQHRGSHVIEPSGVSNARVNVHFPNHAHRLPDGQRFVHQGGNLPPGHGVCEHRLDLEPAQRADGVEAGIVDQLEPHRLPDVRIRLAGEPGRAQRAD